MRAFIFYRKMTEEEDMKRRKKEEGMKIEIDREIEKTDRIDRRIEIDTEMVKGTETGIERKDVRIEMKGTSLIEIETERGKEKKGGGKKKKKKEKRKASIKEKGECGSFCLELHRNKLRIF